MSEGLLSEIIGIRRTMRKSEKEIHFFIEWILPPFELQPRPANHISTVLTARESHANMRCTPPSTNISDFEEIIVILSISRIRLWRAFPALPERAGVGSIIATDRSVA